MMELNVSKRTMMRLIRDCKDQIGVPIPQPNCKEVSFQKRWDGSGVLRWSKWQKDYLFTMTYYTLSPILIAEIWSDGKQEMRDVILLDRSRLMAMGILVEGEEGLVCQG